MVFSSEDKAVIKNDFEEKGWTAYKIWKEHPTKKWVLRSVQRLVNKIREIGTFERRPGSGRPIAATTEENGDIVEMLMSCEESTRPISPIIPGRSLFDTINKVPSRTASKW